MCERSLTIICVLWSLKVERIYGKEADKVISVTEGRWNSSALSHPVCLRRAVLLIVMSPVTDATAPRPLQQPTQAMFDCKRPWEKKKKNTPSIKWSKVFCLMKMQMRWAATLRAGFQQIAKKLGLPDERLFFCGLPAQSWPSFRDVWQSLNLFGSNFL